MTSDENPCMPFGKHKGLPLSEVPTEYLDWLNGKELQSPLKSQVIKELSNRDDWKSVSLMKGKKVKRKFNNE